MPSASGPIGKMVVSSAPAMYKGRSGPRMLEISTLATGGATSATRIPDTSRMSGPTTPLGATAARPPMSPVPARS